ncbi:unnamed protein product [Arctogadus glacialis]
MERVEENTMETPPGLHLRGWRRTDTTRPPPQRRTDTTRPPPQRRTDTTRPPPQRRTDTTRPPPQRVEENRHHQASTSEENRHHQASTSEGGGEQTPPGLTPPQREVLGRLAFTAVLTRASGPAPLKGPAPNAVVARDLPSSLMNSAHAPAPPRSSKVDLITPPLVPTAAVGSLTSDL